MSQRYDVVVVGAGNAAFSAAHAAAERERSVLMLEKAPREWAGGNSYFTAGAIRTTYGGLDDLRPVLDDLSDEQATKTELSPYTSEDFMADMERVTQGRCDRELTRLVVDDAADTVRWLHEKGLRFRLMYDRQSYEVNGKRRFWGGLVLGTIGGGKGLIQQHTDAAEKTGIELRYDFPVVGLLQDDDGAVTGVACKGPSGREEIKAEAVVLASGGFESDPRMRAAYLGPQWDVAKVRGTPYNTGEVLHAALEVGAQPYGNWSGCHSIAWDAGAPPTGDRELTNLFSKQSYPLGIVVNGDVRRFIDEGADFRNYTYAKYGAEILRQPGALAYQIFDAKTEPLLRQDEYNAPGVSRYEASTLRELGEHLGLNLDELRRTVEEFNASVMPGKFDPSIKDGKRTEGIEPPKSNWAQPIDTPPFLGFAVTCGITFTFGGLRVDTDARTLDGAGQPINGLCAAGELVGGLFYHNYPGGSGLMAGSVFGRRAGYAAAAMADAQSA
jgi:tricarballylate dehydrogenase